MPLRLLNQVNFSVNGNRPTQNNWTLDGSDNVDRGANLTLLNYPSVDSIAEFNVLRANYLPEHGRSSSGEVTVITRSGTSQLHGMASDYGRTRIMAHRQFFNLYTSSQPQPGNPNGVPGWFMMPDANVGGPIVIPKIYNGRSRTFFFFGYEKLIEKKTQAYTSQTPTPDELAGDFTFGGLGQKLYDPFTTRHRRRELDPRSVSDQHRPPEHV